MGSRLRNLAKRLYQSKDTASNQSTEEEIYIDDILPNLKDIKIGKRIYSGEDLEIIASKDHVGLFKKVFQNMYPITRTKSGLPKKPRNTSQTENLVQRLKNKFTQLRYDIQSNIKVKGDSTTLRESIEHLEDIKQLINHFEENNTTTFPYDLLETYIENSDIDLFSDDIDEEMSKSYIKQKENTRIKNLLRQFAKIYLQDEYKSNYDLYDPGMSKGKFEEYLTKADQKKLVPVTLGNLIRFLRDDFTSKSSSDADYSKLLQWIDDVHNEIINTKIPEETQEVILNGLLAELQNLRNPPAQVGGDLNTKKTEIQDKIKELVSKYTNMKTKYETDIRFTLGEITKHKGVAINCQAQLDAALQREVSAKAEATTSARTLAEALKKLSDLNEKIKAIKDRFNLRTTGIDDGTELTLLENNLKSLDCEIKALKEAKEAAERAATAATAEKDAAILAKGKLIAEALAEKDRRDAADVAAAIEAALALTEANTRVDEANARAAAAEARLAGLTNQPTTTGEPVDQDALQAAQAEAERARADAATARAEAERAQAQIEATKAEALANIEAADAAAQSMIAATQAEAEGKIAAAQAEAQEKIAAARAEAENQRAEAERQIAAARAAAEAELSAARAAAQAASREGIAEAEEAAQARIAAAEARVFKLQAEATAAAERATAAAANAASDKARALDDARIRSEEALEDLRTQQIGALDALRASHRADMDAKEVQLSGYRSNIASIRSELTNESNKKTEQIRLLIGVLENTKDMALDDTEVNIQSIYDTLMRTIADLSNFDDEDQKTTIKQHIEVIKNKLIELINGKQSISNDARRAAEAAATAAATAATKAAADAARISSLEGAASAAATAAQTNAREAAAAAADAKRLQDSLAADLSGARVRIEELEAQIVALLSSQARMNNPTMPTVPTVPPSIYNPSSQQGQQGQQGQPIQQSSTIEDLIKNILNDTEIKSYLPGYGTNITTLSKLLKRLDQFGLFTDKTRADITVKSFYEADDYDNLTILIDGIKNMVNNYINDYRKTMKNNPGGLVLLDSDLTDPNNPYYKYTLLPNITMNYTEKQDGLKNLTIKLITKLNSIKEKNRFSTAQRSTAFPMRPFQRGGLHSMSLDIANNRYNNNLLEETNPFYSIIEKFDKTSNTNMISTANENIMMERFLDTMLKDHFTDIEMKEFFFEATNILDKKSCYDISTLCFELLEICKIIELSDKNMDVIFIEKTSLNVDFDKLETKIKECPYDFFEHAKKEFPNKKEISLGFFKNGIYLYLETNKFDKMYTIDKQNELHLANFDFNEEIYYVNNHMLYLFFIICNKIINKKKFAELDSYIRKQKRSKTKRMSTLLKERKEIN